MRNSERGSRCFRLNVVVELRKKNTDKHLTHCSLPVLECQTNKEILVIELSQHSCQPRVLGRDEEGLSVV